MRLDSLQHANLADHCYDHNNELAKMAQAKDPISIDNVEYWVLEHVERPLSGYQGTIYQHVESGAIVVAHRGTEPDRELFRDVGLADFGMVATRHNIQSNGAIELTRRALKHAQDSAGDYNNRTPEVTVTGHSLGGTLAQITAHHFGLRGETFNAYGAVSLNRRIPEGGDTVVNHVVAADVISAGGPHYGQVRVYAAQVHIAALHASGYENNRQQVFDLRQPLPVLSKALDFHGMHNFRNMDSYNQPDVSLLRDPQAQQLAAAYDPMIDKYRADIGRTRTAATVGLRNHGGLVGDAAIGFMRGDLTPGLPAQREADHQQPLPGHPLGERLRDIGHATPLPDDLLPGTPPRSGIELPDYLRPAPAAETTRHRAAGTPDHAVPGQVPVSPHATHADTARTVVALQSGLIQLGYHHRVSQPLQVNGVNDDATRQAVTAFQAQHELPISGSADLATQQALQQALLAQQLQGVDARERETEQDRTAQRSAESLPFSHSDHPQHALYADVQQRFQAKGSDLSEEHLSMLAKQMHLGGYRPGWPGDVIVHEGRAMVATFQLGITPKTLDLNAATPSVQETMTTFQADQQSLAQRMEGLHQQQAQSHGHGLSR